MMNKNFFEKVKIADVVITELCWGEVFREFCDRIGAGVFFKMQADGLRRTVGDEEADAFLVAAATGYLQVSRDGDNNLVSASWHSLAQEEEDEIEEDAKIRYAELMNGKPLHLTVDFEAPPYAVGIGYDEYEVQDDSGTYEEDFKGVGEYDTLDLQILRDKGLDFLEAARHWERAAKKYKEDKEKEEKRKKKMEQLRALAFSIDDTGDERVETLVALVKEVFNWG